MQVRRLPSTELYHYGIKGQRWGIRRYQNPDGTLTEAGKARLKTYTSYEISKVNNRTNNKNNRLKDKYNNTDDKAKKEKYKEKIRNVSTNGKREVEALKNYTLEDIKKENIEVGKNAVVYGLAAVGAIVIPGVPDVLAPVFIAKATPAGAKRNYRLKKETTLTHRGIKGQKHGVRRYQYLNGTYTELGNERYRPKKGNSSENALFASSVIATAGMLALSNPVIVTTALSAAKTTAAIGKVACAAALANPAIGGALLPAVGVAGSLVLLDTIVSKMKHGEDMEVKRLSQNELYHHGIKGQRWGVRRYQNIDGSLTALGRSRYTKR